MKYYTEVLVVQVSGESDDLEQCIEEFHELRAGQGLLACSNGDQRMLDQLTWLCEDFIESHQADFDWCKMEIWNYDHSADDSEARLIIGSLYSDYSFLEITKN